MSESDREERRRGKRSSEDKGKSRETEGETETDDPHSRRESVVEPLLRSPRLSLKSSASTEATGPKITTTTGDLMITEDEDSGYEMEDDEPYSDNYMDESDDTDVDTGESDGSLDSEDDDDDDNGSYFSDESDDTDVDEGESQAEEQQEGVTVRVTEEGERSAPHENGPVEPAAVRSTSRTSLTSVTPISVSPAGAPEPLPRSPSSTTLRSGVAVVPASPLLSPRARNSTASSENLISAVSSSSSSIFNLNNTGLASSNSRASLKSASSSSSSSSTGLLGKAHSKDPIAERAEHHSASTGATPDSKRERFDVSSGGDSLTRPRSKSRSRSSSFTERGEGRRRAESESGSTPVRHESSSTSRTPILEREAGAGEDHFTSGEARRSGHSRDPSSSDEMPARTPSTDGERRRRRGAEKLGARTKSHDQLEEDGEGDPQQPQQPGTPISEKIKTPPRAPPPPAPPMPPSRDRRKLKGKEKEKKERDISTGALRKTRPVKRRTNSELNPRWEISMSDLDIKYVIGAGGYGSVYYGFWKGKEVAIKKLTRTADITEAEILSMLSHRNIIQFFGACTDPLNPVIVMEYAPNGTLFSLLRNAEFEIKPSTVLDWARQIASGMNYLHEGAPIQLIHRDLKSPNILVSKKFEMKISDFGLSREQDGKTHKTTAGTFAWMAPELIRNEKHDEKVDVWSYGIVLWEIVTRQIPFEGMEPFAIAFKIATGMRPPLDLEGMPSTLGNIMDRCLQEKPARRLSFHEILRILDSLSDADFGANDPDKFTVSRENWKAEVKHHKLPDGNSFNLQSQLQEREVELSQREQEFVAREEALKKRVLQIQKNSILYVSSFILFFFSLSLSLFYFRLSNCLNQFSSQCYCLVFMELLVRFLFVLFFLSLFEKTKQNKN